MQKFIDIDLSFIPHPATNDVMRIFDLDAIKNSMRNIINGKPFEKPFDEFYGTNIRDLLFTLQSPMTEIIAKRLLKEKLELYEPRITIDNVVVNSGNAKTVALYYDTNQLVIDIYYTVKDYGPQSLRVEMERIR